MILKCTAHSLEPTLRYGVHYTVSNHAKLKAKRVRLTPTEDFVPHNKAALLPAITIIKAIASGELIILGD